MGAFILAGIAFAITLGLTVLTAFGNMMSDNPTDNSGSFISVFVIGCLISAGIASTHWLPHIGW